MSPPESWSLSPPIRRLLLSVLALLPFLFGGSVHAQPATDPSVIDVAVFYTPKAKTATGWSTKQQAEASIEALVTETNLAYTNSDVNQAIKLVAVEEVEGYIQATDTANKTGKNIDLDRLKEPSDGYMDDVHTVRDRVGADIVMLLRSEGGGQAFMMTVLSADSAVGAFGVSTVHAGLFAHEMGHIMGLAHDRYANCMHDTDSPQCPTTVKPYAYGYVNQKMFDPEGSTTADPDAPATARWRTVMAYYNQCRDANVPGNCQPALLRFSNPNQRYPDPTTGDPMGKSGTQNTTAVDGPADAARTLNETRTTVANFRPGRAVQVSFDAGPYVVNEGGSVTVTVRLDAAPGRTLDMPIPLTATSTDGAWPGDYTLPASITFGASQTSKTFTFRAVQDTRQEGEETVILGFGAPLPAGVAVGSRATATVTLTANDADLHRASVPSVSTVAIITELTIPAGAKSRTATFTLTTKDDNIYEPDETVTVSGTTTGLTVTPATLTITDTDGPPTVQRLEVSNASIPILEDGGETTVTVTLSHPSSSETVVGLTVPVGAAAVRLSQRELTIPAEATSGEVTLTAVDKPGDGAHQPVTVSGRVSNLSGRQSPAQVQLTVTDDDPPEVDGPPSKDYTEGDTRPVAEYTATNPADVPLEWLLAGPDATLFRIDRIDRTRGALHFRNSPDYEARADKDYQVTVQAADTTSIPGETLTGERTVTVTVRDALGEVRLSSQQPQVGRALTAKVSERVDEVDEVTEWCWARSPFSDFHDQVAALSCTASDLTTTATYTSGNDDVNSFLRASATYADGNRTLKTVAGVSADLVTARPPPPPPPPPPGRGGGGGPACTGDLHGNTAAQSTDIALSAVTAGAICPAADVDYFTVTAPGQGLVFVDTTGGVQTRGTIWQNDVALASGSTGRPPDERLGARVQAGPVVVAIQGQGGATGTYAVEITFVQGYLENPGADSFQSGVGLLSGWVCEAAVVEIELNGMPQEAAYGTERLDTAGVCGDTDNGFGLLFNWNLLSDGEHEVVALVDGVELGRATVTVTTLGAEFLRGAEGECMVEDFPAMGRTVTLEWQQTSQNFVIAGGSAPSGTVSGRPSTLTGYLENPGPHSFQSGVGVISGWVCDADTVELEIGAAGRQGAAYGTERLDTEPVCGDTDNGFGLLFNWNLLGDGAHTVVALVDGMELGRATVQVTTLGVEFLRDVEGECVVEDFPILGETVLLEWQQNSQNFMITDVE